MTMTLKHASYCALAPMSLVLLGAIGSPAISVADPLPYGPDTCIQGYVWREARQGDNVCVKPDIRDKTGQQNAAAAGNVQPGGGAYGPSTCKSGFVWREAYQGDVVCVTPDVRTQAANDNAAAASRKAATQSPAGPAPCLQNPLPGFLPNSGPIC
jgi:hypothetical protein